MVNPPDFLQTMYAAVEHVRAGDELEIELTSAFMYEDGNSHHFTVTIRRAEVEMVFEPDEGEP